MCVLLDWQLSLPGFVRHIPSWFRCSGCCLCIWLGCGNHFSSTFSWAFFLKSMNKEGAIAGMLVWTNLYRLFHISLIINSLIQPLNHSEEHWLLWRISPEGIGFIGMLFNFFTAIIVSRFYPPPPFEVKDMVETIRQP